MKAFTRILIGLGLAAVPAICGTFNITTANTATDWYGMQWSTQGGAITGFLPGTVYTSTGGITLLSSSPSLLNLTDTWAFNFGSVMTVTVTDMFTDGDRFQLFVDGSLVPNLTTSVPLQDSTTCGNDPLACFGNVKMSSGSIALAGGAHTITMKNLQVNMQSPAGLGAFRVDAGGVAGGVPEPTTLGLIGMGLGGLLLRWRARRS